MIWEGYSVFLVFGRKSSWQSQTSHHCQVLILLLLSITFLYLNFFLFLHTFLFFFHFLFRYLLYLVFLLLVSYKFLYFSLLFAFIRLISQINKFFSHRWGRNCLYFQVHPNVPVVWCAVQMIKQSSITAEAHFTNFTSKRTKFIKIFLFLQFLQFTNLLCFSYTFIPGNEAT